MFIDEPKIVDVIEVTETKVCRKCGKEKLINRFNRDKSNSDGISSYCKACNREYLRKRRERIRLEKQRIRTKSLEGLKK